MNIPIIFYAAAFCASVAGYNFVKYFGFTKFYYRSLTIRLKYIQLVSVLSLIGFVSVFFQHYTGATQLTLKIKK